MIVKQFRANLLDQTIAVILLQFMHWVIFQGVGYDVLRIQSNRNNFIKNYLFSVSFFYAYLLICQVCAAGAPAVKELKSICSQFMLDPLIFPFTLLKIEPFAADLCQTLSRAAFDKAQILKQIC